MVTPMNVLESLGIFDAVAACLGLVILLIAGGILVTRYVLAAALWADTRHPNLVLQVLKAVGWAAAGYCVLSALKLVALFLRNRGYLFG